MKILALAGDAGGARALTPVIRVLAAMGGVDVERRAYAAGHAVWTQEGLQPRDVGDPTDVAEFDRLLLGTSLQPERWETRFVVAARAANVRSVAVLDAWVHYRERFIGDDGSLAIPDAIAVMDEAAASQMIAQGLPAARIVVTGQPALAELALAADPASRAALRSRVRRELSVIEDELVVLFVSQPLSQLWTRETLGFLEDDVLADTVELLPKLIEEPARRCTLVIKRHPREYGQPWARIGSPPSVRILDEPPALRGQPAIEWIVAADAVVGMNSIFLMEAAVAGAGVVSYQPGLKIPDPLPSNATRFTRGVTEPAALPAALRDAIHAPRRPANLPGSLTRLDASQRVIELLLRTSEA